MKVSIIGCTHAGTFAAQSILTNHPDWEVDVFERNYTLSFLSCGIALWVSDRVSDPQKMFYSSPEQLSSLGAQMHMQHDVLAVDWDKKQLTVKNLVSQEEFIQKYDKLVITTGSQPVIPPVPGVDGPHVLHCKNWDDANQLKQNADQIQSAIVIGSGYIGAELAEAYSLKQKDVTLIDMLPHVMAKNFDENISAIAEQDYRDHGVKLQLQEKVVKFEDQDNGVIVTTDQGQYQADIAVLCVGFRPCTGLFQDQLQTLDNGAIIVDEYMQTSQPDVFAAGDAATVQYNPTQKPDYIPLATNAVRQGLLIGDNIATATHKYLGTQATSAVELYQRTYAGAGLTVNGAKARGVKVAHVSVEDNYRPEFMLSTEPVLLNLVWDPQTHRILGGSLTSKYDVSQSANTLSLAIQNQMTIEQLAMVDFFFQPNFDKPINYLSSVAIAAVAQQNQA